MEEPQVDPPEPSEPDSGLSDFPETDLDIPEDPILDFVNSQCHSSEDWVDPPEPSEPDSGLSDFPETDLDIPEDPIIDFVNSQCHSSEDLDQALQA